ncbi:MAG: CHAD domain-containing protein [Kiritimatiellae bacterium]|nr:CHAD domain-containing protein [Kiritimatiellia bacterium]
MKRLTSEKLYEKYGCERAHTAHVTALALRLFDRVRPAARLTASDRRLLEAAARLHDVGFSADPARHALAGARIALREGLPGFTDRERACVAGIILLHPRKLGSALRHPLVPRARDRRRMLRLGAILRVADGLDHSHLQDASIESARLQRGTLVVRVCSEWYRGNVPWAEAKADLWRQHFPIGIRFADVSPARRKYLFSGVVRPGDSILDVAGRVLYSQYRTMADNKDGALAGASPDYLHDIRVALRRIRMALRLFRAPLAETSAARINKDLAALARKLGPIRDVQVWARFLGQRTLHHRFGRDPAWRRFRDAELIRDRKALDTLRGILNGDEYVGLMHRIICLLRAEIPRRMRAGEPEDFDPYAAYKLRRLYRRSLAEPQLTPVAAPEAFHDLRRLVRRGRYWSEFAAPALGRFADDLAGRFKAVADALGDIHDMDVHLSRIAKNATLGPLRAPFAAAVAEMRLGFWADFDHAWRRLKDKEFRRHVLAKLDKARA